MWSLEIKFFFNLPEWYKFLYDPNIMILVQFFRAMWMKIELGKKKICVSANNLEKNIVGR